MRRRPLRWILLLATASTAVAVPCAAQVEAGLDAAAGVVKYDGYLSSTAAALTPSLSWHTARTSLAARGTLLVFESGNASLQGLVTGGAFSPAFGSMRIELAAEGGGSSYADTAQFAHALAEVRLHWMAAHWGAWAGPTAGVVSAAGPALGASGFAAGGWVRGSATALEAAWTRTALGGVAFSDVQVRPRWRAGRLDLAGTIGARRVTGAGGSGWDAYADLTATARLTPWLELVIAGGRYPSDPVRGTIPGRFFITGLRLAPAARSPAAARTRFAAPTPPEAAAPWLANAGLEVEGSDEGATLVVIAPDAQRVEVMGDFTDWKPAALTPAGDGRFRFASPLSPGMYRFNVRLDGGPWGVPRGATVAADDFGGAVGVLVLP